MYFTKSVNFSQTGLSTVGYTLYDNSGAVEQARTTTDIVELGSSGVYQVNAAIPDEFSGTLLWDDGQSEALYAGEDVNQSMVVNAGVTKDNTEYILAAIGQHRSEVEPRIGKIENYDDKKITKKIDEQMSQINGIINQAKLAQKEVKSVKDDIKSIPATDLSGIEEYLKKIEAFKDDYTDILSNLRKAEKNLMKKVDDISLSNRMLELSDTVELGLDKVGDDIDQTLKEIVNRVDQNNMAIRGKLDHDLQQVIHRIESEGGMATINMLGQIFNLLDGAYKESPQGQRQQGSPVQNMKFKLLRGGKK